MATEYPIKRIASKDGTKIFYLFRSISGRYRFIVYGRKKAADGTYWGPTHWSEKYRSEEAAENNASAVFPWISRDKAIHEAVSE